MVRSASHVERCRPLDRSDPSLGLFAETAAGHHRTEHRRHQLLFGTGRRILTRELTGHHRPHGVLTEHAGETLSLFLRCTISDHLVDHQLREVNTVKERLDQHVKVNGKYAYLQEDRAWVDKPFYTLKRAVIRNLMLSCADKMHPKVKFGLVAYSIDIKDDLVNTCNYTQGYGELYNQFSLTGRRRGKKVNGKAVNWFETGFVNETVVKYIDYVYTTLEEAIKNG